MAYCYGVRGAATLDASLPSVGEDNSNIGYNDGTMTVKEFAVWLT